MSSFVQPGLHGAFMASGYADLPSPPVRMSSSRLVGIRLAVKDVFEIAGLNCSAGNPQWLKQSLPAPRTATAVQFLLTQGCQWIGKTVTDELTYSLAGINAHFGTPVNPAAPECLPGGSSSGSAVAVAGQYADLALGTDCGGSIRLPASYCGVWGMRPSHGRVASDACFTLAHSFDTVGWFARDGETLGRALESLLHTQLPLPPAVPYRLLVSDDVLSQLDISVRVSFEQWLIKHEIVYERLCMGSLPLDIWAQAFRTLQAAEIWQQHGEWVKTTACGFGADVAQRFAVASKVTREQVFSASQVRSQAQSVLTQLLSNNSMLLMPPVPGGAPRLDASAQQVNDIRTRSQKLLCMAGLAGLPQVVMPWQCVDGAPVGLSLMGARFADEHIVQAAHLLHSTHFSQPSGRL